MNRRKREAMGLGRLSEACRCFLVCLYAKKRKHGGLNRATIPITLPSHECSPNKTSSSQQSPSNAAQSVKTALNVTGGGSPAVLMYRHAVLWRARRAVARHFKWHRWACEKHLSGLLRLLMGRRGQKCLSL